MRPPAIVAVSVAVAFLLRLFAAARTHSLYPDGVVELETAQALLDGRWTDALNTRFHPLYALMTAVVSLLLDVDVERAALGISICLSSAAVGLVALTAARLVPRRPRAAALAAGLLAAAHPILARLGGQVMAYGVAHACLAGACLLTVLAVERRSARFAGAAGLCIGLGYMARTDLLVSGLGLGIGVSILALLGRGERPLARLRLPALFLIGTLLGMSPYVVALRAHSGAWRLSLKKDVGQVLDTRQAPPPPPVGGVGGASSDSSLPELILRESGKTAAPPQRLGLGRALRFAGGVALETGPAWIVVLALLGALIRARESPALLPLLLAGGVFIIVQGLLKANWNTTDKIHQSALGVLLAPVAARGLLALAPPLARRVGLPARLTAAAVLSACLVPLAAKIKPNLPGRGVEARVGSWIRSEAGEGPLTVAGWETRVVAYRAGARFVPLGTGTPRQALASARAAGAEFGAIYLRSRDRLRGELAPALLAAGVGGLESFESHHDGKTYTWLVFRLQPLGKTGE